MGAPARRRPGARAAPLPAGGLGLSRFFAGSVDLDPEELEEAAEAVAASSEPVHAEELEASETALRRLAAVGAVEIRSDGEVAAGSERGDPAEAAAEAARVQERRAQWDRSRVEMIRGYAELEDCRREFVLNYFGERYEPPCGNCDNCQAGVVAATADEPFELGTRVEHARWGGGLVQRYEADKLVVLFDDVGYKTLALELVRERDLLRALA